MSSLDLESFYNKPEDHPLWPEQVSLEQYMLRRGAEQFQSRLQKATDAGELTRMAPQRQLMKKWIEPTAQCMEEWLHGMKSTKGGPKPMALKALSLIDPMIASLIAIRTILDQMVPGKLKLVAIANEIGLTIEHEAKVTEWQKHSPSLFQSIQDTQRRKGSTAVHIRRVNIHEYNKLAKEDLAWKDWSDETRIRVGIHMVDFVVRATRAFSVTPDPTWKRALTSARSRSKALSAPLVIAPTYETSEWLAEALQTAQVSHPHYMPTIVPPRRWSNPRNGGYWTKFVRTPWMIRFKANQEQQRKRAIDDFMAMDMPVVYAAINRVQEVGWKVNPKVLEVAKKLWERGQGEASMPRKEPLPLPAKPTDIATNEVALKVWKRAASDVYGANARMISRALTVNRTLDVADILGDHTFYFPHMLDFRGRMYPIPSELSPQGQDLARGLLTFAEGKPIRSGDEGWLGIQLANSWGNDKVSYEDRLTWVQENRAMWERIAKDPMASREWMGSENPWQTLAAIFEVVAFWEHGEGYVSALPVRVDGTCNGLQHLAIMSGDIAVASKVNVLPSPKPADIYQDVADDVTLMLEETMVAPETPEDGVWASKWYDIVDGKMKRAITKRPVMILPYGGTMQAYTKYTLEWLNKSWKAEWETKYGINKGELFKMASWLSKLLWKAVVRDMAGPLEIMKWLQKCSSVAARRGLPLYWTTPAGFVVRHFYGEMKRKRLHSMLDGKEVFLVIWQPSDKLSRNDQLKGIAPNFVHSQDASILLGCVRSCDEEDIRSITTIHDSFGTVAADMAKLNGILRECFVANYSENVLESFRASCLDVCAPEDRKDMPALPKRGALLVTELIQSDYFFA